MDSLANKLITTPVREKSGSTAFNRFSFQNNWALCHLLSLHEKGEDYIIAFDFHDDIVEINSSKNNPVFKFYQIKTKRSGNMTRNRLIKRNKDTKGNQLFSYLGKMYCNYLNFPNETEGLIFVSNACFNIDLTATEKSESKTILKLTEASINEKNKIIDSLKDETQNTDIKLSLFELHVTDLSIDGHKKSTLGAVTGFLHNCCQNTKAAVPFHQALSDEISRRAGYELDVKNLNEFIQEKALSKETFQNMLNNIVIRTDFDTIKQSLISRLDSENISFINRNAIREELENYEIDLLDANNHLIHEAKAAITYECSNLPEEIKTKGLYEIMEFVSNIAGAKLLELKNIKGLNYIKAMVAVSFYE